MRKHAAFALLILGIVCIIVAGGWLAAYLLLSDEFNKVVSLGALVFSLLAGFVCLGIAGLIYLIASINDEPAKPDYSEVPKFKKTNGLWHY